MTLLLSVLLFASASTDTVRFEAEDAELFGSLEVATARAGYSGSGYVDGSTVDGDSLRFVFESEGDVLRLRLRVGVTGRSAQLTYWLDGVETQRTILGGGAGFVDRQILEDFVAPGTHTLVLQGNVDVDYLEIVPFEKVPPPAKPTDELADPLATPTTQALHRFLLDIYGQYILAGQQDMNEIQYIEGVTGKTVAVGAFDLIEYSPSRVECGSNPGRSVENWIDWAEDDALVTLAWHWNAPTDLIDDDCIDSNQPRDQSWWRGFYTEATNFNFAEALEDTTSERYQLILRDIDAIAVQLQKFADADLPVLWRPLHEAAGGWFWWGARGPEPFVQLWRLMYDRLVHHHELHNLIWVFTHEPNAFAWYPGDDYVDIVSRDVYAQPGAIMQGDWDQLQELYGDRKLVTLSESGTLPRPEQITAYGIWWSWFALWNGQFIRGVDQDYLTEVFTSDLVITRDELPNWRSIYSTSERPSSMPSKYLELQLYPNPTAGASTLSAILPTSSEVRVDVFDVTGRRVRTYQLGTHSTGTFTAPIEAGDAAGTYLVQVTAGDRVGRGVLTVVD